MKIESNRPIATPNTAARPSAAAGFSVPADPASTSTPARQAGGAIAVGAMGTLLALQGVDDPMQRRARHIRRGHDSLDALERLKLGLLEGGAPGEVSGTLQRLLREREDAGDGALNDVMDQIDVRVAVELAKLERRRAVNG